MPPGHVWNCQLARGHLRPNPLSFQERDEQKCGARSAWVGPAGPAKQILPMPSLQAGSRSSMSSTPLDPTVHSQSTSCLPHQWYLAGKALPPHSASCPFSHLAGCSFWMFLLVLLFPDFQTLSARGAVLGPLPLSFHTPFLRGLHQYPQLLLATPKLICLPWTSSLN